MNRRRTISGRRFKLRPTNNEVDLATVYVNGFPDSEKVAAMKYGGRGLRTPKFRQAGARKPEGIPLHKWSGR